MSILKKTKSEIVDQFQFTEYERDGYWELVFNDIAPLLDIDHNQLNNLSVNMYNTVICKEINELKENNEKLKKENEELKKENEELKEENEGLNDFISDDDGEDIELTDSESESDLSEHSSDRDFIDDE